MRNYITVIIILFLISNCTIEVICKAYYLSGAFNRSNASSQCQLYGSRLSGHFNKIDVQTNGPTNTLVWISAVRTLSSWYSYKGCYVVENVRNTTSVFNDLAFCSQFCQNYQLLAVREDQCFCLSAYPLQKSSSCTQKACSGNANDFCGSGASYLVYQKVSITGDNGNCVATTTYDEAYYYSTKPCDEKYGFICKRSGAYIYSHDLSTWNEAVSMCHQSGNTISDTFYVPEDMEGLSDGVLVWVGIFRKEIFYWSNDSVSTPSNCVAGLINESGVLTPVGTDCSDELPVLCENNVYVGTTASITPQIETLKDYTFIIIGCSAIAVMILFIIILFCSYNVHSRQNKIPVKQKLENEDTSDTELEADQPTNGTVHNVVSKNYSILDAAPTEAAIRRPMSIQLWKERLSGYYNSLVFGNKRKKRNIESLIDIYDHVELNTDPYNSTSTKPDVNPQREAVAEIYDHVTENDSREEPTKIKAEEEKIKNTIKITENVKPSALEMAKMNFSDDEISDDEFDDFTVDETEYVVNDTEHTDYYEI